MSGPEVNFRPFHPWGKIPEKKNVSGQNKPYDSVPESDWVVCQWCGWRVNTSRHAECPFCESDNY